MGLGPSLPPVACEAGFGVFLEVFLIEKTHRTLASGALARTVSSGRSAREGAKRADAG
jgi:hypothetical protein